MTKPMYCPMSFCNPELSNTRGQGKNTACITPVLCTPDCAWAVKRMDDTGRLSEYGCAIAFMTNEIVNTRPLKDDAE